LLAVQKPASSAVPKKYVSTVLKRGSIFWAIPYAAPKAAPSAADEAVPFAVNKATPLAANNILMAATPDLMNAATSDLDVVLLAVQKSAPPAASKNYVSIGLRADSTGVFKDPLPPTLKATPYSALKAAPPVAMKQAASTAATSAASKNPQPAAVKAPLSAVPKTVPPADIEDIPPTVMQKALFAKAQNLPSSASKAVPPAGLKCCSYLSMTHSPPTHLLLPLSYLTPSFPSGAANTTSWAAQPEATAQPLQTPASEVSDSPGSVRQSGADTNAGHIATESYLPARQAHKICTSLLPAYILAYFRS
jgi:hypothetical protein